MAIALAIFGVAFGALCVWLAVRIINRRERWAKWTLAAVVGLPVVYVLTFGPACWIASRTGTDDAAFFVTAYWPMWSAMHRKVPVVQEALTIYAATGMRKGNKLQIPSAASNDSDEFWAEVITISVE